MARRLYHRIQQSKPKRKQWFTEMNRPRLALFLTLASCIAVSALLFVLQDDLLRKSIVVSASNKAPRRIPLPASMQNLLAANRDYRLLSLHETCGVIVSSLRRYSVVCFRGRSSEPLWVVRDSEQPILDVLAERDAVTPIFCYDCDSNRTLRWSGSAYEAGIHVPGERVCIVPGTKILDRADAPAAAVLAEVPEFAYVDVLEIGAKTDHDTRWQRVRLLEPASADDDLIIHMRQRTPDIIGFIDSNRFFRE